MFLSDWGPIVFVLLTTSIICYGGETEIGKISALYAVQNRRAEMEDYSVRIEDEFGTGFYAILDGHEGNYSSNYAKDYLTKEFVKVMRSNHVHSEARLDLKKTLNEFTDEMEKNLIRAAKREYHKSGTTCLMVVAEKYKLTVGNVGDSRGVMCDSKGWAIDLSIDHIAARNRDEKKRIIATNGEMRNRTVDKLIHGWEITRSLGDLKSKEEAGSDVIISKPEIKTFDLTEHKPKFMILASQGLWDKVGSQAAVELIKERYLKDKDFGAKALAQQALLSDSRDNITVMVIVFKSGNYEVKKSKGLSNFFKKN